MEISVQSRKQFEGQESNNGGFGAHGVTQNPDPELVTFRLDQQAGDGLVLPAQFLLAMMNLGPGFVDRPF